MGETVFMIKKYFFKKILSTSNIYFLLFVLRALYFCLIYYTLVLKFNLKGAIGFFNAIACRGLIIWFIDKFF